MKTLKLAALSIILALAVVGTSQADGFHAKNKVVKITINKALTIPGLVKAMYEQLDDDFLKVEKKVYVCSVKYENRVYLISGTRLQWMRFFKIKPTIELPPKNIGLGTP